MVAPTIWNPYVGACIARPLLFWRLLKGFSLTVSPTTPNFSGRPEAALLRVLLHTAQKKHAAPATHHNNISIISYFFPLVKREIGQKSEFLPSAQKFIVKFLQFANCQTATFLLYYKCNKQGGYANGKLSQRPLQRTHCTEREWDERINASPQKSRESLIRERSKVGRESVCEWLAAVQNVRLHQRPFAFWNDPKRKQTSSP